MEIGARGAHDRSERNARTDMTTATAGIPIVDCDSHWTEPPDLWTSRAPRRLRDRMPHVVEANGVQLWRVGDVQLGPIGLSVVQPSGAKVLGRLFLPHQSGIHAASWDPRARLGMLDALGIDVQIVYPNVAGFASIRFLEIDDEDLRNACVAIYNDAAAELQQATGGRLRPQAILPFWDMKATLAEMRRAREVLRLTGFTITDSPERLGLPDYGDPSWTPFFELAEGLDVPLDFHIASGGTGLFTEAPWKTHGPERQMAVGGALLYLDNARMLTNLLYSDVLERHPRLRFVSVESGVGWIPFLLDALEYQWDQMIPTEVRHHALRPTEKFKRNVYACFWFEERGVERFVERLGADNLLFETDFPHPTCLYPAPRARLDRALAPLAVDVRHALLHRNAERLYGPLHGGTNA
jgi:predicted TIM-barrel fold metal-dependent hydrolase